MQEARLKWQKPWDQSVWGFDKLRDSTHAVYVLKWDVGKQLFDTPVVNVLLLCEKSSILTEVNKYIK